MLDSGATGNFIHPRVVKQLGLRTRARVKGLRVTHVEGKTIGTVTRQAIFHMRLGEHREELTAEIIPIGKHSLILGMPWLVSHNPKINWRTREITFRKENPRAQVFEEGEAELYEVTTTPLEDAAKLVPKEYHEYLDVFDLDKARTLPPL